MLQQGMKYRGFQVGGTDGFDAVLAELREADLLCWRGSSDAACCARIAAANQDDGDDSAASGTARSRAGAGEAALAEALETMRGPEALIVVYERDTAPAKIRRAAEQAGLAINCPRPYDNQLTQFAEAFARVQDLRLGRGVADLLISRHAGDLSAIANTLAKAAIHREPGATLGAADLGDPAAAKIPDLFELAEALSNGSCGGGARYVRARVGRGTRSVRIAGGRDRSGDAADDAGSVDGRA